MENRDDPSGKTDEVKSAVAAPFAAHKYSLIGGSVVGPSCVGTLQGRKRGG